MAFHVSRCLLVGLGGTGQNSLAFIKRRMIESYGEIPPVIRFLSFDADKIDPKVEELLDQDEFVALEVEDVATYRTAKPEVDNWLDTENIPWQKFRRIDQGAGQIRQLGRLALNVHLANSVALVQRKLREINDWQAQLGVSDKWSVSKAQPQIIFFGSIAGGTGGGTLLDLAAAIKSLPDASKFETVAYLILPGVFMGKDRTHYVEENSYAFLKELDFFTSKAEDVRKRPDLFSYSSGATTYSMAAPFDRILLIDNERTDGIRYDSPSDLAEAVALAVLTTTGGPMGDKTESVLCNPGNDISIWEGGKKPIYSTFGICEVHYPSALFAKYGLSAFADRLAQRLVIPEQDADAGSSDRVLGDREAFLAEGKGLREKGKTDNQIGNRILPISNVAANIPKEFKAGLVPAIWTDNEQRVVQFVASSTKIAAENRAALVDEVRTAIHERIVESVRVRGGQYATSLVSSFKGYFESVLDEMMKGEQAEAAVATRSVALHAANAKALQGDVAEACKKWFSSDLTRKLMTNYQTALGELGRWHAAAIRAQEVGSFCNSLVVSLDDLLQTLSAQQATAGAIMSRSSHMRENLESQLTHSAPFERIVIPALSSIDLPEVVTSDFWGWLADKKGLDVLGFWSKGVQEAYDLLIEYGTARDVTKALRDGSLMTVVDSMSEEQRDQLVKEADAKAAPLLRWQTGIVNAQSDLKKPTFQYLIGASAGFLNMFTSQPKPGDEAEQKQGSGTTSTKSLQDRLATKEVRDVHRVELDDKDRAYFFKFYGALPAYSLSLFDLMRDEYLDLTSTPGQWCLHLDKRWDGEIPDPSCEGSDEDLWIWSLAVSDIPYFKRVKQSQDFFYFVHTADLGGGIINTVDIPLGQGRANATTAFLRDKSYLAEAGAIIASAVSTNGNGAVRTALRDYAEQMKVRYPEKASLHEVVGREIAAIGQYIEKKLG